MESFSSLLPICEGNSQRPVTRSFDISFDLRLNKQLSKTLEILDVIAPIIASL